MDKKMLVGFLGGFLLVPTAVLSQLAAEEKPGPANSRTRVVFHCARAAGHGQATHKCDQEKKPQALQLHTGFSNTLHLTPKRSPDGSTAILLTD
jgi:hypothetical protein